MSLTKFAQRFILSKPFARSFSVSLNNVLWAIDRSKLKYSDKHEWINVEGNVGTVGITDYAQVESLSLSLSFFHSKRRIQQPLFFLIDIIVHSNIYL